MTQRGKVSKGRRSKPNNVASRGPQPTRRSKRLITLGLACVTIAVLVGLIVSTNRGGEREELAISANLGVQAQTVPVSKTTVNTEFEHEPKTCDELLSLPVDELAKVDIARMNLLCAADMPSTQGLDVEYALSVINEWARKVALETDRHLYRVTDPRYAERYQGSEAHFRAEMLAQVLQEDLGVHYNKSAIGNFSFADPSVAFIHGMIPGPGQTTADTPGGTCASMPVLYVAVGRRLGYPLKLCIAKAHVFARWDGEAYGGHENPAWRETFNCETTNGFTKYDDDYYRNWPTPVSETEIARNGLLKSLSPIEEFAQFLGARGHHGKDVGAFAFAARCFENAYLYDPERPCYQAWFKEAALSCNYQPSNPALARMIVYERAIQKAEKRQQETDRISGLATPGQAIPVGLTLHDPHVEINARMDRISMENRRLLQKQHNRKPSSVVPGHIDPWQTQQPNQDNPSSTNQGS